MHVPNGFPDFYTVLVITLGLLNGALYLSTRYLSIETRVAAIGIFGVGIPLLLWIVCGAPRSWAFVFIYGIYVIPAIVVAVVNAAASLGGGTHRFAAHGSTSQAGNSTTPTGTATAAGPDLEFAEPARKQRTKVRALLFELWIDHDSGDVDGLVLTGRFIARNLNQLSVEELEELHADCVADEESLKLFEAYLERRLGSNWRNSRRASSQSRTEMTREEALALLGLEDRATAQEIQAAHSRLIRRVHPDVGGTNELAARINRARDILLP